ncbi:ABC transporter permease [Cocleimonas flava]|uniref:Nucleoside ABC transporter membrane protein n=1 Tax=Cocleimonas flava TaxID=634765 RepID=A0A4R1F1Y5_9GAMM|nr:MULTISPECIES: ABC transporter permease [Cocleimonas]MEB8431740.1 ABC transporter permease [Cocleimonas sp. KMM 6892]MEC4715174.1 ABC transporter permease [Cocleimonas sp. KMM 6895]MEC4744012.1 ABC transporter permease [Cocleimonas sp. KMM 6896]TCJ87390.1 nucleoside ABC transporter membrane protein [Cocleimonas flava]
MEILVAAILTIITAATPLLFAALGELVTEKSGVLNLGVEGMMVMGAIVGFAAVHFSGSATVAIFASMVAGASMAAIFGVLVLVFHASQVPTGLALTIFGIGLSALVGQGMIGVAYDGIPQLHIPVISDIPVIGEIFFSQDGLVYLSIFMVFAVMWFMNKTRAGLILRAVGDSHDAAHAMGYSVLKIRFLAVIFGGAMAGVGGAYLSLAYSPLWVEQMTAGRGWIALALVVFASWKVRRVLMGAYLFGGISILQLHAQALGIAVPSQVMSMLPYLATILVLVIISRDRSKIKLNAPASLGKPFHASR